MNLNASAHAATMTLQFVAIERVFQYFEIYPRWGGRDIRQHFLLFTTLSMI